MTDDPAVRLGTEPTSASTDPDGTDAVAAFEDRLLKGAHLRDWRGAEEPRRRSFHVRVEDLLAGTGRRGAPRS
jgi:hypothetical protein